MVNVSPNNLVGKLDPEVYQAFEQAAWLCRSMTHYDIELEHLFIKLAEGSENDIAKIFQHFEIDPSRFIEEVTAAAEKLKRGNTRDTPGISPRLPELFQAAWTYGSVEHGHAAIRSGTLLHVLRAEAEFHPLSEEMTRLFRKIDTDELDSDYAAITKGSSEESAHAAATSVCSAGATRPKS